MDMMTRPTYSLCELDGTPLKVPIAGKRVKLFKKREGQIVFGDEVEEQGPEDNIMSDAESDDLPDDDF